MSIVWKYCSFICNWINSHGMINAYWPFNWRTWKFETFSKFREFKDLVENKDKYIKVLRLDGGGEYDSKEFINFVYKNTSRGSLQQ